MKKYFTALLLFISLNKYSFTIDDLENKSANTTVIPRYTNSILERPKTLPEGIFSFYFQGLFSELKNIDLAISSRMGLGDRLEGILEIGGLSFPELKDARLKRTVSIGAKYSIWDLKYFKGSGELKLPIHIWDGEILKSFVFSLPLEVQFNRFALGFLHDFFTFHMRPMRAFEANFPVYLGWQIDKNLWAQFESSLGLVKLTNVNFQGDFKETKLPNRRLPMDIKVLYTINKHLDTGLRFGFDNIYRAKNTFRVGMMLNLRGGKLS